MAHGLTRSFWHPAASSFNRKWSLPFYVLFILLVELGIMTRIQLYGIAGKLKITKCTEGMLDRLKFIVASFVTLCKGNQLQCRKNTWQTKFIFFNRCFQKSYGSDLFFMCASNWMYSFSFIVFVQITQLRVVIHHQSFFKIPKTKAWV